MKEIDNDSGVFSMSVEQMVELESAVKCQERDLDAYRLQLDIERQGAVEMAKVIAGLRTQLDEAWKDNNYERAVWSKLYNQLSGDPTGNYAQSDLERVVAEAMAVREGLRELCEAVKAERQRENDMRFSDAHDGTAEEWQRLQDAKVRTDALVARLAPDAAKDARGGNHESD